MELQKHSLIVNESMLDVVIATDSAKNMFIAR